MSVEERLYTVDDLRAMEQLPGNEDKQFELIRGVIVEVTSASPEHNWISNLVAAYITLYVQTHGLGFAFGDRQNYYLNPEDEFIPDASFVSKQRLAKLPKRIEFAPDLAVEVISPSNNRFETVYRVDTYLRYGSRLVWTIYPREKVVRVHRLEADGSINTRKFDINDTLDGEDVLPGFKLAVHEIFPE